MEIAAGVVEGVLGVCGIVSFADAVDLGGDLVACFEGGGGAGEFFAWDHGAWYLSEIGSSARVRDAGEGIRKWGVYYFTFSGSAWYPDVSIPNSEGASPLRTRRSDLLSPAALTQTNTQFSDGRASLG